MEETETPIVVTAHKNADPDAVAAAYAVKAGLSQVVPDADLRLILPEGMNQASKRVVRSLLGVEPADFEDEPPEESGLAIIVDTASIEQLGKLREFIENVDFILIDHHEKNSLVERAIVAAYDPSARASVEIVYGLLEAWGARIDEKTAALLLAGLLYDTRHLRGATARSLRIAAELMDRGASLQTVITALQSPPMSYSERVARVKAAMRMRAWRLKKEDVNDVILAVTHVKAFESSVARALIDLGADAVFVVSVGDSRTRIVARSNERFARKTGVHLGEVMAELGRLLGRSEGGGHRNAAAVEARIEVGVEDAKKLVLQTLRERLAEKGFELEEIE